MYSMVEANFIHVTADPRRRCLSAAHLLLAMAVIWPLLDGAAAWGASFSSPRRIVGTAAQDAEPPQLATSGANVYVAWHEAQSATVAEPEVWFARSTNNGGSFGSRTNLSSSAGVYSSAEQIFATGSNVFVVWTEDTGTRRILYFRRSTNGGASFGPRVEITRALLPSNPRVTAAGANVVVAWQADQEGNIYVRHSTNTGASFAPKINVSNSFSGELYFQPDGGLRQIAISGTKVIVTWRDVADGSFETFVAQGAL